ncbi:hypothetical protein [Nocardia gipuzkoensis]|uniref:hypothetical protein n=1 Tax=Nocardia gipuzkoensis TaxID=2749991 RepID=UPI00237E95B9|nr:hypothetical protein [Nocardia gipuzkoensis]MDE1673783.1 hypothetical protein [Nocardia gipuzkoensis]
MGSNTNHTPPDESAEQPITVTAPGELLNQIQYIYPLPDYDPKDSFPTHRGGKPDIHAPMTVSVAEQQHQADIRRRSYELAVERHHIEGSGSAYRGGTPCE